MKPDAIRLSNRSASLFLISAILILFFLKTLGDYDFWFHLMVGREVVSSGHIPTQQFYISSMLGTPELFFEWGFGTLLYLVLQGFGPVGLSLLNTALAAGSILILAAHGNPAGQKQLVATLLASLIVAMGVEVRATLRPELLLFVAVAATLVLIEKFNRSQDAKWLYPIPAIAALLANLHPSALILFVVAGCYGLQALVREKTVAAIKPYVFLVAGMIVAATINPYGIEQLLLPFRFAGDQELTGHVVEFFPILDTAIAPLFVALACAAVVSFVLPRKDPNAIAHGLLVLVFGLLTLRYSRNIGLFSIVLFYPLRHLISVALAKTEAICARPASRLAGALSAVLMVSLLAAHRFQANDFGVGFSTGIFPSYAEQLEVRSDISGIASLFHLGGYLAWTTRKPVLADGRNYSFSHAMRTHNAVFSRAPEWESLLEANRIDTIFLPTLQPASGTPVPLLGALHGSPKWKLCALDEIGLWFARSDRTASPGLDKDLIFKRMNLDLLQRKPAVSPTDPVLQLNRARAPIAASLTWPPVEAFCWSEAPRR